MSRESRSVGRPPDRQTAVSSQLRDQIVHGVLAPGAQLPARTRLRESFQVSHMTVQRALDQLRREGFVYTTPRGTFVATDPPHLCRYAMSFPVQPVPGEPWSRFWTALHQAALSLQEPDTRQFGFYFGINDKTNSADFHRLMADARVHRFAGIVFASPPFALADTDILAQPDMPRVGVMASPFLGVPAVYPDFQSFYRRALAYLATRGRRRIANLSVAVDPDCVEQMMSLVRSLGMTSRPQWQQGCTLENTYAAGQIAHLLFAARGDEVPDALIISDDNLVEHACGGLIAAGVRVPQDLDVIAHCNYPCPAPNVLPVRRLGFDCARIMRQCIEIIDTGRRGGHVPERTLIPAQFEEELGRSE